MQTLRAGAQIRRGEKSNGMTSNTRRKVATLKKRRVCQNSTLKESKLVEEIRRHLAKGRSIETICIWMELLWMELPESRVRELLAK